jgi:hypothetical protein
VQRAGARTSPLNDCLGISQIISGVHGMDRNEIAEIGNLPVEELKERLPALSLEQLDALLKIEKAGAKRDGALKAIGKEIGAKKSAAKAAEKAAGAEAPATEVVESAGKAASKERPAWQQPDYAGPLDIGQMEWRRHNIKPVTGVRTK